jgi:hypothetical protein
MRPFHATAADRLARYEAMPHHFQRMEAIKADPLANALYFKRDRWLGDEKLAAISDDDDAAFNHWSDVRNSGVVLHRAIIERLWATRFADRAQARMLSLANTLPAATDKAVEAARTAVLEKA